MYISRITVIGNDKSSNVHTCCHYSLGPGNSSSLWVWWFGDCCNETQCNGPGQKKVHDNINGAHSEFSRVAVSMLFLSSENNAQSPNNANQLIVWVGPP